MFTNLDRILSGVAEGIVALDRDLRYVFINDAAEQMLGHAVLDGLVGETTA